MVANASAPAAADAAVQAAPVQVQSQPAPAAGEDDAHKQRKRRRRRHGRPLEGADAATTPQATTSSTPAPASNGEKPSLISRIGRRLKSLVGG